MRIPLAFFSLSVSACLAGIGDGNGLRAQVSVDVVSSLLRDGEALAYDAIRDRVVLFGGRDSGNTSRLYGDTWEWDGGGWQLVPSPVSPPARHEHRMAFDPVAGRVVLFGGEGANGRLGDTWTWDGSTWHEMTASVAAPVARSSHGLAWHAGVSRVVLFGGVSVGNGSLGDTWVWDGATWTQVSTTTAPSARSDFGMATAPLDEVVLYGDSTYSPFTTPPPDDTWTFNGTDWVNRGPAGAPAESTGWWAAFDPIRQRTLFVGGIAFLHGPPAIPGPYEWDGTSWTARPDIVAPAGPLASSPTDGGVLVRSSFSSLFTLPSADTWIVDASPGSMRDTQVWPGRARGALLSDSGTGRVLSVSSGDSNEPLEAYEWTGSRWIELPTNASRPPARDLVHGAFDSDRGKIVLFGGGFPAALGDTWEYDRGSASWMERSPSQAPPPGYGHAMAYDPLRHVTVLFGGYQPANGSVGDRVWEWDGTTWTDVTPMTGGPVGRTNPSFAFDPVVGGVLLFGGRSPSGAHLDDTWVWDGAWHAQTPAQSPPVRDQAPMAWDAARSRMVLQGGVAPDFNARSDFWEWDGTDWTERAPAGAVAETATAMAYDAVDERVLLARPYAGQFNGNVRNVLWSYGPDYPARFDAFGSGCAGTAGVPSLGAQPPGDRPYLGDPFTFEVSQCPPTGLAALIFGSSNVVWGSIVLPFDLAPLGAPGCDILIAEDIVALVAPVVSGSATWTLTIPFDPALVGLRIFTQASVVDPGANMLGLTKSDGRGLTLGIR